MTTIVPGGQAGAVGGSATTKVGVQAQLDAMASALRQMAGSAVIGAEEINDPLNSPYVLYVNPYTGSDSFVSGSYSVFGSATQRIELQRLECGYSEARPFRTINRAIIEVGIITAKSYYEAPFGGNDLVSIVLSTGAMNLLNGPGVSSVPEWVDGTNPTDAQLQAFNSTATGGIILPRGCSVVAASSDLRKTILRPAFVPSPADEAADASNRRSIFKVTGTGYYWGMTFMDKVGSTSSHHLLHCFEFASQPELDEFYGKIRSAFAGSNNTGGLDPALAVTRTSEYEIVGPRPASGNQTIATDTVNSASPYIFNCSIRSVLGLCGVYGDGAKTSGFRSIVLAQFTGVSLQRDLSCWQKYDSSRSPQWGAYFTSYDDFIKSDPDDVRMHPKRRSFHIRAKNDAIMQEVSVFAIGQGIHHWVESGGELTITNSNSNFGSCAALAEGYKGVAFAADSDWNIGSIRVATNLSEKRNNIRKIYLGVVDSATANNATTVTLDQPLADSISSPGVPDALERDGYSLKPNSYVWVENPRGADYRALLASTPWNSGNPNQITVSTAFRSEDDYAPGDSIFNSASINTGQMWPSLAGARLYIRRLKDSRTTDERRFSLRCNTTNSLSRTPVRDYVLQTGLGASGIVGPIPDSQLLVVASASSIAPEGAGVGRSASVELRRINANNAWVSGALYRTGDTVRQQSKSWGCIKQNSDTTFDTNKWEQSYCHMEEEFRPEDFWKNTQPAIVFDNDTDPLDDTISCGYNLNTVWATDPAVQRQYRSATDYRGAHSLLVSLGFNAANAHSILLPQLASSRERNPNSSLNGIGNPAGSANAWNNWAIEFRRPSNIRLFGHAWEWAGYLSYTKALPEYQLELSPLNKFTYYFTNNDGGRVYGSGFNEEGFLITPQGLQDLATGTEISVETIGDRDVPIDEIVFPQIFDQISANTVTVNTGLELGSSTVAGNPTWEGGYGGVLPALPNSTASQRGIIELATGLEVQEFLRDDLAVSPATLIQALGDAVKSVVNLRLSLSSSAAVPSSNQLNRTSISIHPYNGNEIALYSPVTGRWQLARFNGVTTFSLASANQANTNYDIYVFNSGTVINPVLSLELAAWPSSTTEPTRSFQDGILVRSGNAARRFIGVIRTTSPGTSTIDLGGTLVGGDSANYPRIYLANYYNLYDARAVYFFGNNWNQITGEWAVPPAAVYPTAPRVAWVQATNSLVTAFLDIYNNPADGQAAIVYVAPGINSMTGPPPTAFYGESECGGTVRNLTSGSQWAESMPPRLHEIFYLYKQFDGGGGGGALVNEHPGHGMIVLVKV